MLDTVRKVETPEGVELSLSVAGPVLRSRAWFCDLMIKSVLLIGVSVVLGLVGGAGVGLFLIFVFLIWWLYPVVFEVLREGATPGKQIVGLRVIHDDGMPVGWSAALIRSLVGFVDMFPGCYAIGLVATLLNNDSKRLGDMAAGTVVIHRSQPRIRELSVDVPPICPPVPLLVEEQQGLVEFAARSGRLSQDRLEELARVAGQSAPDDATAVRRLLGQARWVTGNR